MKTIRVITFLVCLASGAGANACPENKAVNLASPESVVASQAVNPATDARFFPLVPGKHINPKAKTLRFAPTGEQPPVASSTPPGILTAEQSQQLLSIYPAAD